MSTTRKQTAGSTQNDKPTPPAEPSLITEADFAEALEPEQPKSVEEIHDELLRLLWERRGELKGIALVNGLKAIAQMKAAKAAAPPDPDDDDQRNRTILDQVDRLPKAHAKRLLKEEIARRRVDLETHEERLRQLEGGQ